MKRGNGMDEKFELLKELCKPIREYLADNYNPHTTFLISTDRIKIVSDEVSIPVNDEFTEIEADFIFSKI